MYLVKYGDITIHRPLVAECTLIEATLNLELNTAGEFDFAMAPNHIEYETVQPYGELVTVYDDDECLFCGFITSVNKDFRNNKRFVAEGMLALLADAILTPTSTTINKNTLLRNWMSVFNSEIGNYEPKKKIETALCRFDVPYSTGNRAVAFSDYISMWDGVNDMLENNGGYVFWRKNSSGQNYIEYVKELTEQATQPIVFGQNLMDLIEEYEYSEVFTAITPIGNNGLTIESVNRGNRNLINNSTASVYGYKWVSITWNDITDPNELMTVATDALLKATGIKTITATAFDMGWTNEEFGKLRLGQNANVISKPHKVNETMLIGRMTLDLNDIGASTITLGRIKNTLTKMMKG